MFLPRVSVLRIAVPAEKRAEMLFLVQRPGDDCSGMCGLFWDGDVLAELPSWVRFSTRPSFSFSPFGSNPRAARSSFRKPGSRDRHLLPPLLSSIQLNHFLLDDPRYGPGATTSASLALAATTTASSAFVTSLATSAPGSTATSDQATVTSSTTDDAAATSSPSSSATDGGVTAAPTATATADSSSSSAGSDEGVSSSGSEAASASSSSSSSAAKSSASAPAEKLGGGNGVWAAAVAGLGLLAVL